MYHIFTFGAGHLLSGTAIKVKGDKQESRKRMFDFYGDRWAFQYSEEEWEKMKNDPNRDHPMEEITEVIE